MSAVIGAFQQYEPVTPWTRLQLDDIKRILAICERIDRRMGEPDCVDPEKDAWMKRLEERIEALEASRG